MIEGIAKDPQVGDVFRGKVVRIMQFGAFVEFAPGKDGLVHISKLADKRVEKVEDVVNLSLIHISRSWRALITASATRARAAWTS